MNTLKYVEGSKALIPNLPLHVAEVNISTSQVGYVEKSQQNNTNYVPLHSYEVKPFNSLYPQISSSGI